MKKALLLFAIMIIGAGFAQGANAEISVKEYMSYEFLDTQGYSGDMLKLVEINKAKTFGEKMPSHWSSNKIQRGWQKFWAYIDPAEDYGDFGSHDIKMKNTVWDY